MSAYRRFISYMYDYRHDHRKKNCGYVKIEVRNNHSLILFQLKNAPCQETCNAYLCFRGENPEYLFLHAIPIHHGNTQFKIETSSIHMMGSNYTFSQCCGILCTDEKGNNCYTSWDGKGILPEYKRNINILSAEPASAVPMQPETPESVVPTQPDSEPDIPPQPDPEPDMPSQSAPEPDTPLPPDPEPDTLLQPDSEPDTPPPSDPEQDTSPQSDSKPDTPPQPPISTKPFSEIWAHMQQEFQPLDPFEDNVVLEGIKIAPSDLGYLQSLNLDLGTNQFLLHGYKSYHHLLMGRLHGQLQYVIGVPGIYDPQEQFMAKMFGFPCFKPIRESRQKNGQFGYWMRCFRHPR